MRLGPLVEARGFRGTAGISTDILGLLPLSCHRGVRARLRAPRALCSTPSRPRKLHVYAEWTTAVSADEGDLTDVEVGLRYFPLDALALTVGYRQFEIDVADGNEMFSLKLDGPYFGGVLRF